MSFNFTVKEFILGNGTGTPSLQFYRKGFELSSGGTPSYQDIVLSGVGALTLSNALADSLNYLKLFGACEQRNLPVGYTQLEYIESTGTQYIDTGVKADADYSVDITFTTPSTLSNGSLFGNQSSDILLYLASGKFSVYNNNSKVLDINTTINADTTYSIKLTVSGTSATISGDLSATLSNLTISGIYNILIGANHNASGNVTDYGKFKYNSVTIQKGGAMVFGTYPAKDSSNNIGIYDVATSSLKQNAGSGDFTAGPTAPTPNAPIDIKCNNGVLKVRHQSGLPLGYVLLDGITGDGTAYIDLDTTLDQNDDIEIEFLSPTAQTNRSIFGSRLSATSQNILLFYGGNTNQIVADFNNSNYAPYRLGSLAISANVKYKAILNKNIRAIYQGSTLVDSNNTVCPDTISINSAYLFYASGTPSASDKYTGTIYSVKIAGKRVLVPCKNANNEVGMYDFVSGRFFGNVAGSGAFIAGNVVSDAVEIYTDGTVETVEVHGKNLFDKDASILTNGWVINAQDIKLKRQADGYTWAIKCQPSTTYTVSHDSQNSNTVLRIAYGSMANLDFTSSTADVPLGLVVNGSVSGNYRTATLTTSADATYIFIQLGATNQATAKTSTQLELGSTATTYVPYYNGGTATAEMLLKVGTYQDVQSILDGQITRKVGVKVLDGTEDWIKGVVSFATQGLITNFETSNNWSPLCTHGVGINGSVTPQANSNQVRCNYTNFVYTLNLSPNFTTYPDTTAWKAFLADQYANGTPVIVVYPLATATTESVTPQSLTTQAGTNIVEITQASIDNLPLEVSYKATV